MSYTWTGFGWLSFDPTPSDEPSDNPLPTPTRTAYSTRTTRPRPNPTPTPEPTNNVHPGRHARAEPAAAGAAERHADRPTVGRAAPPEQSHVDGLSTRWLIVLIAILILLILLLIISDSPIHLHAEVCGAPRARCTRQANGVLPRNPDCP